ncbi:3-carboxy-cis,cis-muconate cycloisomerase [Bradyrhizobium diazoefficiens]
MPALHASTTVLDSMLFRDAFGTPEMREVFSDVALVARYAEVEVALAKAEAKCGVIPQDAADQIAARTDVAALDFDLLRQETDIVGYPILPLVHQMVKQCGDAGRYVHWGATTQDIMDTAVVLQLRAALEIVERDIAELRKILADLSRRHRDTPMAGRTHLQQALPVTFGYKTAIWLAMFDRHAERLAQLKPRVLVGEFAGAAGTLASLGDKGFEVQEALCDELKLGVPASTWHVARDGFAEAVNFLALVTGSLGKIALDIMIMASTEFAEVYEPFVKGRGASSTMPQKRNPISSELMLAAYQGGAPARGPDAGCDGAGFRARHRPLARRVDGDPRKLRAGRGGAAPGEVRARGPHRRRGEDERQSRHQPGPDCGRSGHDGARAPDRAAGGA